MPGIAEGPLSMPWHFARFVSQVSVLSVLLTLAEVGSGASLERDVLRSEDVFILDAPSEIFVWVGKGATPTERKEGMLRGVESMRH